MLGVAVGAAIDGAYMPHLRRYLRRHLPDAARQARRFLAAGCGAGHEERVLHVQRQQRVHIVFGDFIEELRAVGASHAVTSA